MRLPNSPHEGMTPRQIANADRRAALVRDVVDRLVSTPLPPTADRTEAVISLCVNELSVAEATVMHALHDADAYTAASAIAAELLYRLLGGDSTGRTSVIPGRTS